MCFRTHAHWVPAGLRRPRGGTGAKKALMTMQWIWPLVGSAPLLPDAPGRFGAIRAHDAHTGVDCYAEIGQQ
ncbi:hypothetical protein HYV74_03700, partial [Candidatus Uhrbacteria bacterium]|nr:hypothetical protein [Candidatus Uhrbacteria bacterium]